MSHLTFENILLFILMLIAALCFAFGWPGEAAAAVEVGRVAFDFTVNVTAIITVIIMTVGGVAAWVTLRIQVRTNTSDITKHGTALDDHKKESAAAMAAINTLIQTNAERIEQVRSKSSHELATFQLAVAKEYATSTAVDASRREILEAIGKLTARLDTIIQGRSAAD